MVRLRLDGVNQVGEFHRVLDEEHRHVVAHQVPIAFIGIELDGKAAHIARRVFGAPLTRHGGKAHKYGRYFSFFGEGRSAGVLGQRVVTLKVAMRCRAPRVHDALGNALVVEVGDLFAQHKVFQQRRSAQPRLQ